MLPGLTSALTAGNSVFAKVASAFAPLATHAAYEPVPPTAEVIAGAMNAAAARTARDISAVMSLRIRRY